MQETIHVSNRANFTWSTCQIPPFRLVGEIDPNLKQQQYVQEYRSMKPMLKHVLGRGVRVFLMYGDSGDNLVTIFQAF